MRLRTMAQVPVPVCSPVASGISCREFTSALASVAFALVFACPALAQRQQDDSPKLRPGQAVVCAPISCHENVMVEILKQFENRQPQDAGLLLLVRGDHAGFGRFADRDKPYDVLIADRRLSAVGKFTRQRGFPASGAQPEEFVIGQRRGIVMANHDSATRVTLGELGIALAGPTAGNKTRWAGYKCWGQFADPGLSDLLRERCMTVQEKQPWGSRTLEYCFRKDLNFKDDVREIETKGGALQSIGVVLYTSVTAKPAEDHILAVGASAEGPFVKPRLEPTIQDDYPLSELVVLYLHPQAPDVARRFCEFCVGEAGAKIAEAKSLITPWHQRQYEGDCRLAEMKHGKGTHLSALGVGVERTIMPDLTAEYVRANKTVQLSFEQADAEMAAIYTFVRSSASSRELLLLSDKPSERALGVYGEEWKKLQPIEYIPAGRAVAIIVNPANKLESLTLDQVRAIFAGEVGHWAIIGDSGLSVPQDSKGKPGANPASPRVPMEIGIKCFGLGVNDPAACVFHKECLAAAKFRRVTTTKDTAEALAAVSMDAQAIAFVDLAAIPATGQTVKVLGIRMGKGDQEKVVMPTPENIRNATYPLSERLYLYVHPKASDTAKDFAKFIASCGKLEATPYADTAKAVTETYRKHGLIPLSDPDNGQIAIAPPPPVDKPADSKH